MDVKGDSGEVSDDDEEHVIGNKKAQVAGSPCRAMGMTLPT